MMDSRYTALAETLVNYSCEVASGEKVFIEAIDIPHAFTCELIRVIADAGGIPLLKLGSNSIQRALLRNGSDKSWQTVAGAEETMMKLADCYIGVRGNFNISELSDVTSERQEIYEKHFWKPIHLDLRVKKTRWVVLRWPTPSMAQQAEMSTEAFEDFFFNVCTLDYTKVERAMQPLIKRMEKTELVRIVGPGDTDLTFSIKDIPVVGSCGKRNIPDGEVFTAPIRESAEGVIHYNVPTIYRGETHQDIRLVFEKGKIVEATSSQTARLNKVLNTDEGARYVGEFAIGFNPYCTRPMKDILFDEKMAGSIHFTPGQCYEQTENGNRSSIHWDMVLVQTPEYGGGKIYFDDELIRADGQFVVEDLQGLNPDQFG